MTTDSDKRSCDDLDVTRVTCPIAPLPGGGSFTAYIITDEVVEEDTFQCNASEFDSLQRMMDERGMLSHEPMPDQGSVAYLLCEPSERSRLYGWLDWEDGKRGERPQGPRPTNLALQAAVDHAGVGGLRPDETRGIPSCKLYSPGRLAICWGEIAKALEVYWQNGGNMPFPSDGASVSHGIVHLWRRWLAFLFRATEWDGIWVK